VAAACLPWSCQSAIWCCGKCSFFWASATGTPRSQLGMVPPQQYIRCGIGVEVVRYTGMSELFVIPVVCGSWVSNLLRSKTE
jgi:hypothetical protein